MQLGLLVLLPSKADKACLQRVAKAWQQAVTRRSESVAG